MTTDAGQNGQGTADDQKQGDAGNTGSAQGAQNRTFTQEDFERELGERLQRERNKYKDYGDLKKASEELAQLKQSQMSEAEKHQARVKELETERETWQRERRELAARDAVITEAEKLKAKSPTRVFRLISTDLTYDDDGKVTNVAAVLKDAQKEFPELFNSQNGSADGGAGNGRAPGGVDMNTLIRQKAGLA